MMRQPSGLLIKLAPLGLAIAVIVATPALALEGDAEAPVEVAADQLDLDDNAGTAVYTGDVEIQQGSMQLTGDRVEIQRNAEGQLTRATAYGERAYIEQQPSPDDPLVRGWGRTVIYHVAERRVELIDRAELHQGGDTFDGAYLEYFLDRRVVQARSESAGIEDRQRVRMTLQPEN